MYGDQVVGINSAELWVSIDPAADYDATVAAVQETVDGYAGLGQQVSTYLQQTLSQPQATKKDGITVRVFGEDLDVLRGEAEQERPCRSGDWVNAAQARLAIWSVLEQLHGRPARRLDGPRPLGHRPLRP